MRIYIAGSITNNPNYMHDFEKAEKELLERGHEVLNPAKNNGSSYKEYIDKGLKQLMSSEAVFMLKGYQESKGALLEHYYAQAVGIEIIYQ